MYFINKVLINHILPDTLFKAMHKNKNVSMFVWKNFILFCGKFPPQGKLCVTAYSEYQPLT